MKSIKFSYNLELLFLFFAFFSILNNGVFEILGIRLYLIIGTLGFFFYKYKLKYFNNILTYELLYFFILYFIIKLFIQYEDKHIAERTILQKFDGRYLSQLFRIILEIITSVYFYTLYLKYKSTFLKTLLLATNYTIIIALIDYLFLNTSLYHLFLGNTHVSNRFTALNIEPRMFGLILVYVYVFLKLMNFSDKNLLLIVISIFLTISVSSIIIFLISFLYFNKKNKYIVTATLSILFFLIAFLIIPFKDDLILIYKRLDLITTIDSNNDDYYSIFSILEVFDRAALNSLFNNKIYLITGFGPNTISIPSSDYIAPSSFNTYGGIINSVPHTGLINILSRSGFIFLLLFGIKLFHKKKWFFFLIYLLQMNFIFYSFYLILYDSKEE